MCKILIIDSEYSNKTNTNIRCLAHLTKLPLIQKRIKFNYKSYLESKESRYYDCFNDSFKNITCFTKDEKDSGGSFISEGSVIYELVKLKSILEFEYKYKSNCSSLYKKKFQYYQALENAVLYNSKSDFEYIVFLESNKIYDNDLLSMFNLIFNSHLRELLVKLNIKPIIIEDLNELDFLKKITKNLNINVLTSFDEAIAFANNNVN